MVKACLLVKTTPVKGERVLKEVSRLKGVKKAFLAYGRADVVILVDTKKYEEVLDITSKVHALDGVRSTETLIEAW
jgi:DNA-binding Lrp family transcriptional regulator